MRRKIRRYIVKTSMQQLNTVETIAHKMEALCLLSNVEAAAAGELFEAIQTAADPETAVRVIEARVITDSPLLKRKWREVVWRLWGSVHPDVPRVPDVGLASAEVKEAPFLQDAVAYLALLAERPAELISERGELLLATADIVRLRCALPSVQASSTWAVENEWGYLGMRRLRATLQAMRLIRPVNGRLSVVRSRYERWRQWPATLQFYTLWHADIYHTNWVHFGGMWGDFMHIVQDNLPILWEVHGTAQSGTLQTSQRWCLDVLEAFSPLWYEAGLFEVGAGRQSWLKLVRQNSIGTAIHQLLLSDLFERHGLLQSEGMDFSWTERGITMLEAERQQRLPCAVETLK